MMDSVRGAAAFAIVLGHAYGYYGSGVVRAVLDNAISLIGVAVPVFFALSGFLLFRPFVAAQERGATGPTMRSFLRRRALRILPAYWVALTLAALIFGATYVPGAFSDRWWVFYGFGQVYSLHDNAAGLSVAWSLCVEVSFYALLPLLAWFSRRAGPWWVIVPMLVLGPVIHTLNTIVFDDRGLVVALAKITYALPGEANFFAVGMALAVWSVREAPAPLRWLIDRPRLTVALAAVVYLAASQLFAFAHPIGWLDYRTSFIGVHLASTLFCLLVMLPAVFDVKPGPVRRVLNWRPLVFVGAVSYGLYLWHVPVGGWLVFETFMVRILSWDQAIRWPVTMLVMFGGGMVFATLSYYLVELPFLRRKEPKQDARPLVAAEASAP